MAWRQHLLFRFNDDWCRAAHSFAYKLSVVLGDVLVSVAASPREDLLFHDGNVLVVVKEDSLDVRWKVIEVEREVEKEFNWKIGISPIIVKDDERGWETVRRFLLAYDEPVPSGEWKRAVDKFVDRLSVVLGDVLVSVAASPREDLLFHDGNVLVVVKEDSLDVRWKVIEVEREVEKEFNWKIGISPIIVKDDEKEFFLEAFR